MLTRTSSPRLIAAFCCFAFAACQPSLLSLPGSEAEQADAAWGHDYTSDVARHHTIALIDGSFVPTFEPGTLRQGLPPVAESLRPPLYDSESGLRDLTGYIDESYDHRSEVVSSLEGVILISDENLVHMEQAGRLADEEPWIVASLSRVVLGESDGEHFGFVVQWTTPLIRYNATDGLFLYDYFESRDAMFELINGVALMSLSEVPLDVLLEAGTYAEPYEGP